ncbi:hypothetical protein EDB86DRAFT_2958366 [Lactarius hatsudake]|nr:hypothetical protein EDB86DRAFT_2958366 [Lactarius hatsudake]
MGFIGPKTLLCMQCYLIALSLTAPSPLATNTRQQLKHLYLYRANRIYSTYRRGNKVEKSPKFKGKCFTPIREWLLGPTPCGRNDPVRHYKVVICVTAILRRHVLS